MMMNELGIFVCVFRNQLFSVLTFFSLTITFYAIVYNVITFTIIRYSVADKEGLDYIGLPILLPSGFG